MELFQASHQWATRPADQRFWTVADLHTATHHYAMQARTSSDIPYATLRTQADNGEVMLVGKTNVPAKLTHWAFGQLAARVGAPAGYLRGLPATLAVQCLNNGLAARVSSGDGDEDNANLLFHSNGSYVCRAITSDKYSRIWNYEVAERLLDAADNGWRTPPGWAAGSDDPQARRATVADVFPGGIVKVGDMILPTGLYASDHDMFVFLVNEEARINDGTPGGLARGVFVSNSEVGAAKLRIVKFLYRYVCGNNIVWGAKDVQEVAFKHVGNIRERSEQLFDVTMKAYANESASDLEAKIKVARSTRIAATKEEVLDTLFGKRVGSRKSLEAAYDACLPDIDGEPNTIWGWTQGATRVSQETKYTDERVEMDRVAARVLEMAF
jgi:hypothetical protein